MLSETDVHYITGFLYLATHSEEITVILGEKVFDEASESHRDVDIVIAKSRDHGIIGAEVKDEARRLHVGLVEALCQKFADMPSLEEKWIVSASGFTEPALRKAAAHGVKCLRFVRGRLPPFETIDISHLSDFSISHLEWREGPSVALAPSVCLSDEQRAELTDDSPVTVSRPFSTSPQTARQLADRVVANCTEAWPGPEQQNGLVSVHLDVEVADSPVIELQSGPIVVTDARITGIVEWVTSVVPVEAVCYLETPEGEAVAGTLLVNIRTGLLGMVASPWSQRLRFFHIPSAVRNIRPIQKTLSGGKSGA